MTEHERVQAECAAWIKKHFRPRLITPEEAFSEGWIAAKEDTNRIVTQLGLQNPAEQKPFPTFDEWFRDKHACGFNASVYARKGLPYDQVMLLLSEHLRAYVSEMVQRR